MSRFWRRAAPAVLIAGIILVLFGEVLMTSRVVSGNDRLFFDGPPLSTA